MLLDRRLRRWPNVVTSLGDPLWFSGNARQTLDIDSVLVHCWAIVCDAGPTLQQHRVNVP